MTKRGRMFAAPPFCELDLDEGEEEVATEVLQ